MGKGIKGLGVGNVGVQKDAIPSNAAAAAAAGIIIVQYYRYAFFVFFRLIQYGLETGHAQTPSRMFQFDATRKGDARILRHVQIGFDTPELTSMKLLFFERSQCVIIKSIILCILPMVNSP